MQDTELSTLECAALKQQLEQARKELEVARSKGTRCPKFTAEGVVSHASVAPHRDRRTDARTLPFLASAFLRSESMYAARHTQLSGTRREIQLEQELTQVRGMLQAPARTAGLPAARLHGHINLLAPHAHGSLRCGSFSPQRGAMIVHRTR